MSDEPITLENISDELLRDFIYCHDNTSNASNILTHKILTIAKARLKEKEPSESELRLTTLRGEFFPMQNEKFSTVDKITGEINKGCKTGTGYVNRSPFNTKLLQEDFFLAPPQYAKELSDVVTGKYQLTKEDNGVRIYFTYPDKSCIDGLGLGDIIWESDDSKMLRTHQYFFTPDQRANYIAQLGKEKGEEKKEPEFAWVNGKIGFGIFPEIMKAYQYSPSEMEQNKEFLSALKELNKLRSFCIVQGMKE